MYTFGNLHSETKYANFFFKDVEKDMSCQVDHLFDKNNYTLYN